MLICGCENRDSSIQFAQLTDLHVSPGSESERDLKAVVKDINSQELDFVVVTGDLTNTGSNRELLNVKKILDEIEVPCYVLPGNHETNWSESAGLMFNELWGNDRFIFSKGDFLFVGFNTGPYMKMGDGHVKKEDLWWLKKVLIKRANNKTLISLAHYPLADGLDNWVEVTSLLRRHHCKLALCGHGHRFKLFNFDGIPGVMGRALSMNGADKPGYTLVRITRDSAFIYNKEIDEDAKALRFHFSIYSPDTLKNIQVNPIPSFSLNKQYPDLKIGFQYVDSASIFTGPCLVNRELLVYGNSLGWMKCVNVSTGNIKWKKRYKGALFSTPVTNGEVIAYGNSDGHIMGVDAENGKEIWSINVGTPVISEGAVDGHFLYVGGGQTAFYKIDMNSGEVMWAFEEINGLIQGKPALGDECVVFGAWDTYLYCLDKKSGVLNWKWTNESGVKLFSPGNVVPAISEGKVFFVAPDRYMTALDLKTGEEIWRSNIHKVRESMGKSPDGQLIIAKLMNDSLVAMSAATPFPKTVWSIDAGIGYDHNPCPVVVNSQMAIGATKNGLITAVAPDGERVLWKYKVGNSSINKIVVDENSNVWITLMEGRVLEILNTGDIPASTQ